MVDKNYYIEILSYSGNNPFLKHLKSKVRNDDYYPFTKFEKEYINRNLLYCGYKFNSLVLGVGRRNEEYLQQQFKSSKKIETITVDFLFGETNDIYHFGYKTHNFFVYKSDCENPFEKEINIVEFDPNHFNNKSGRKLYDYQVEGIKFMMNRPFSFNWDDMGLGKMQAYDSKVLTPKGFVEMREIVVGSYVIGSNGKPTKVIGVFPQPHKEMYNITFTDGTVVECCGEHLWAVKNYNDVSKKRDYQIKCTNDLIADISWKDKGVKWFIPIVSPVEFETRKVLIDPYVLGCLIGDGTMTNKCGIRLCSKDLEIIEKVADNLPETITLRPIKNNNKDYTLSQGRGTKNKNILQIYLEHYGLFNKTSIDKFIPHDYKYNTVDVRINMLQGLLDTDGTVQNHNGSIIYYTISKQLCADVREIVESLGGICTQRIKKSSYKNVYGEKIECNDCYVLYIKIPNNIIPFKLQRKIDLLKPLTKYFPTRGIKKIEFSRISDGQCIKVDAEDQLYVMDHYVVTHNTTQSIVASIASGYKKILVVTLASLKINWRREIDLYHESSKIISGSVWDNSDARFTIINYEILSNFIASKKSKKKKGDNSILSENYDCIILDEVHRAKNPKSIQSNCLNIIATSPSIKKIIGLSGTPFEKNLDLYNICRTLNLSISDIIKQSKWYQSILENYQEYVMRYCNAYEQVLDGKKNKINKLEIESQQSEFLKKYQYRRTLYNIIDQYGTKIKGIWYAALGTEIINVNELTTKQCEKIYENGFIDKRKKVLVLGQKIGDKKIDNTNSEELNQRIKHVQIRRTKKQVLYNFPEKIIYPLFFELTLQEKKKYVELWNEYLELKNRESKTEEELLKTTESIKVREFMAKLKVPHTLNFVENKIEDGNKVIVFTHFKEEYDMILKGLGKNVVGINATMTSEKKQAIIDKFQNDENVRVIVGNIKTLGTGHNLTKGDIVISNSPDWNSGEHEQSEDRAFRLGRSEDVTVFYCLFEGTHEEEVFNRANQKADNKKILLAS